MTKSEEWCMIRELLRQGLSLNEIARRTRHDWRIIRRIRDDPNNPMPLERRKRGGKLAPTRPI